MIVNWSLESYEGGEGVIHAEINSNLTANIMHSPSGSNFFASVIDLIANESEEKTDPSLIELMNWVEEELKFRMSHG